jgi:hypothetical protein
MNIKRAMAVASIALLPLSGLLAGCGGSDDKGGAAATTSSDTGADTAGGDTGDVDAAAFCDLMRNGPATTNADATSAESVGAMAAMWTEAAAVAPATIKEKLEKLAGVYTEEQAALASGDNVGATEILAKNAEIVTEGIAGAAQEAEKLCGSGE